MSARAVTAVVDLVAAALGGRTGPRPVVVGIDGRSGAGKSVVARDVVTALAEVVGRGVDATGVDAAGVDGTGDGGAGVDGARADGGVLEVRLDDAYPGWDGLAAGVDAVVTDVLAPLAAGRRGWLRRYDWSTGRLGEPVEVPPPGVPLPRVVVLEGCGAGSARAAPYVDVLVWVEAPEHVRRARAMARDGGSWLEWWPVWAAQEEALLRERDARADADLVFTTG